MFVLILTLIFLAIGCSQRSNEGGSGDLTSGDSTLDAIEHEEEEEEESVAEIQEQQLLIVDSIDLAIDEAVEAFDNERSKYFTIFSSFTGYENSAEATWIVDEELVLKYSKADWNMEGTSGNHEYYFEGDDLKAGDEENFYNDYEERVRIYNHVGENFGYSRTVGTENDSLIYILQDGDFSSRNQEAKGEFFKVLERIRQLADSVTENDDEILIRFENVVNYGEDVTETEEYRLKRKIFQKILDQRQ